MLASDVLWASGQRNDALWLPALDNAHPRSVQWVGRAPRIHVHDARACQHTAAAAASSSSGSSGGSGGGGSSSSSSSSGSSGSGGGGGGSQQQPAHPV
jgi:uncharacterized membrane protein YgcG